jgi:ATP-dependent DNA helicase RecG
MRDNGSPTPIFETDEDRTWFRVTLPIQPAFNPKVKIDHKKIMSPDQKLANLVGSIVANDQGNDQATLMMSKLLIWLQSQPRTRSELLEYLGLKNHSDNVKRYIEPMEINGLMVKTIPNKPKSPKQMYRLTEKGSNIVGGVNELPF